MRGVVKINKSITILTIVCIILIIGDLISTLILGDLVPLLEANPLYQYIGIAGILILTFGVVFCIYMGYRYSKKVFTRFIFITIMVTLCLFKIFVIINNVTVYQDPPTMQQALQVTTEMKQQAMKQALLPAIIPYLISILAFIFFQIDHDIKIKKKNGRIN